jgi:phenylalanine-4-hydroxylase
MNFLANLRTKSSTDAKVWKVLFDRQTALLHRRAAPAFGEGLAQLGYSRTGVPLLAEVSRTLQRHTGWQLEPVTRVLPEADFFALLAQRKFPVMSQLRSWQEFDFSPTPDLFHDLFGHAPLLLDGAFADFLHHLGRTAVTADADTRANLAALYFFTADFGLVHHEGDLRLYGAGLLSSAGEIHHCVDQATPRLDFDLATVLHTPVRVTRFQDQYFVLPSWAELAECVAKLATLLPAPTLALAA